MWASRASVDHAAGRPQHWSDVDADVGRWVAGAVSLVERSCSALVGIYLHGSLAMGSYFRPKSDVDLLVVVDAGPSHSERRTLAAGLVAVFDRRPTAGGLELSVVQRRHVGRFEHPLPYELHFSEKWADDVRAGGVGPRGTDRDLAAHCHLARCRGIALRGPDAVAVIGPVPDDAFLDAVMDDARWIVGGGILASPFYGVLNLCRVLQVFAQGTAGPPSKDQGGEWALCHVPVDHHPIIRDALECQRSAADVRGDQRRTHGHRWNEDALTAFAAYARSALPDLGR